MSFKLYKLTGMELNPERFGNREPLYQDVLKLLRNGDVKVEVKDMVSVNVSGETLWISKNTYEKARGILGGGSSYEAHEGVTLTSARGAWWIIGKPEPVEPPIGAAKNKEYVRVETKLSRELGLEPFIVEKDFVFKGFKGEDIEVGRINISNKDRYFLLAYKRDGTPLKPEELQNTFLWKNYLSNREVQNRLGASSSFLRNKFWHVERMNERALAKYKVVWRDVADEFIPAVCLDCNDLIPDYTVNYVAVNSAEEAFYLMAILLSPQINAVVRELSPWIGHVQPRFLRYFKIPRYSSKNDAHRRLMEIGREISQGENLKNYLGEIEKLVERINEERKK